MQCTAPHAPPSSGLLSASPRSLAAAFAHVPAPRRHASVTYALSAILTLAVAAILANPLSVLASAAWGARQSPELLCTLGFPDGRTPCQSTLQRLFSKLDGHALSAALGAHFAPTIMALPADDRTQGVAVDGQAQRGRLPFQDGGCPVQALTAFCHEHGVVLAHEPIAPGHAVEKGEAELSVAPTLLARVAWPGRVLTGDALFCQRPLCQQVLDAGGDYLLLVKENQPTLYNDLRLLVAPPPSLAALPLLDQREAQTHERGQGRQDEVRHLAARTRCATWPPGRGAPPGRQDEVRHLVASTDLNDYVDWPGLAQVFRLQRTWREHGQRKHAVHYGITSLATAAGPPERLLALKRGHWIIENGLHRVKDVALGEDQSTIHHGQGPTVMALLREAALNLLRRRGVRQISARLRYHSQHPAAAIALLVAPPPVDA